MLKQEEPGVEGMQLELLERSVVVKPEKSEMTLEKCRSWDANSENLYNYWLPPYLTTDSLLLAGSFTNNIHN